ncbi:MAG: beta-ketoacyl-ACP synthase [Methylacidiphilales bacterium]|nr:beta-ketoacyl-ACP synthase [Candidatus Methylacidiphilales bacterium]NJR18526.1 beta-ketoacyl-ACP synthase [Calothrix sp. CSU_2_0]
MKSVVVTGIGLVSALGESLETSWKNLITNKSGIKLIQPFAELESLPLAMIGKQPAELQTLTRLAVSSAMVDSGLISPLPDCGVVIGSSRGFLADWEKFARQIYGNEQNSFSPPSFIETLPHMNAIAAARQIGATGIVLAPMAACATGIWALSQATMLIQTGQCDRVVAGAVEAPITPLTITGFEQMGALAKTGAYPFDVNREGLVLGEGGAVFVLESRELAEARQARIYGEILGFGLTADAYHPNSPQPEGKSATIAIKQCLQQSNLQSSHIDYVHAHGTGTIQNDEVEGRIIRGVFTHYPYVSSTKGATGHTIGASGALGVAFSLMALQQQILPPCVGVRKSGFDLNLVRESSVNKIKYAMCLSFGFGGANAVIALGR